MEKLEKFSDFARQEIYFEGDKITMSDVIDKVIYILGWRIIKSVIKGKECLQMQVAFPGAEDTKHVVFSNSEVLIRQCKTYNRSQFETTIKKRNGKYYVFS